MSRKRGRKEEPNAALHAPDAEDAAPSVLRDQDEPMEEEQAAPEAAEAPRDRRAVMADVARRRAAHFAHFQDEDAEEEGTNVHAGGSNARTLGPWSSAVELVNAREQAAAAREDKILKASRAKAKADKESGWDPSRDPCLGPRPTARVASLFSVCLELLVEHVDAVVSLWGLPDSMRTALAVAVCAKRKMTAEVAQLFADGAPAELLLPDCTQLDAEAMRQLLSSCCSARMEVLELGSCGRGFGDDAAAVVAAAGPLSALTSLRIQGAYRLTDSGLQTLLAAAGPSLARLAVPQCSRLTGQVLGRLPALVPALRSLDLSDCRGVDVAVLCGAVPQLMGLQRLALDGLAEVDDAALRAIARTPALRELSIGHCPAITDAAISALASARPQLESLCMDECSKISDGAIHAVARGCKGLRTLSVRRCAKITDAALAEVASNGALKRLVVAGVVGVGPETLRALAAACKDTLEELDVSFCRNVPERSLGLVADRCTHLRFLKVYGCSQLTALFVHGHSNEALQHIKGLGPLETYTVAAVEG